jgi:hypothetical protein
LIKITAQDRVDFPLLVARIERTESDLRWIEGRLYSLCVEGANLTRRIAYRKLEAEEEVNPFLLDYDEPFV